MVLTHIDSLQDSRLEPYRALKERELRAEGAASSLRANRSSVD